MEKFDIYAQSLLTLYPLLKIDKMCYNKIKNENDLLYEEIKTIKEKINSNNEKLDEYRFGISEIERMIEFREGQERGRKWREENPEEFEAWFSELKQKNERL